MEPLKKAKRFKGPEGPVVLAILDGVGIGTCKEGDMVTRANTPVLDWLSKNALSSKLQAHGTAVGMPSDADMGNSEIGHNTFGFGPRGNLSKSSSSKAMLISMALSPRKLKNMTLSFSSTGPSGVLFRAITNGGRSWSITPGGPKRNVLYAGMMQYDGDAMIPQKYLVNPPGINRTVGEYLVKAGVKQLAISETQKFGHVTYFFNGNRSGKFDDALEDYVEIPSDTVPFEQRPWMKAAEITDRVVEAIKTGEYKFIRLNYANGDMVGHTGIPQAVEIAVETVDLCIGRLVKAIKAAGGILIVTADHGNSDDMYECNTKTGEIIYDEKTGQPKPRTAHSLNPVFAYIYEPSGRINLRLTEVTDLGISSLAATCLRLLGFETPEDYTPSIITIN